MPRTPSPKTPARKKAAGRKPAPTRTPGAKAAGRAGPGDWRAAVLDRVRALIEQAVPGVVEEVKWRKPTNPAGVAVWSLPREGRQNILCTGETYKDKVKVTFAHGAALEDPAGLFNASTEAGTRRAIDLREGERLDGRAFKALVKSAAAFYAPAAAKRPGAGDSRGGKGPPIHADVLAYNAAQAPADRRTCDALARAINANLPGAEHKIWHAHPVWFLEGNPIVGYSKLKDCVRLLFWSGQSFDEPGLTPEGKFKAAEARFTSSDQVPLKDLKRWLAKAATIQWDYKNIVKRKGRLERLK